MNSLAESLTGWNLDESVGKELREVFTPLGDNSKPLYDFYKKNDILTDSVILKSKQGNDIPVKCNLKVIKDDNYDINGFILVFNH
jgi:PAS domain